MAPEPESKSHSSNDTARQQDREEFFQACMLGNIERVREMLMYSFDVNITDGLGNTPIMKAAQYGQLEIVKLLLSHHADITAKNGAGWTALDFAINCSQPEVEEYLHNHGAKE